MSQAFRFSFAAVFLLLLSLPVVTACSHKNTDTEEENRLTSETAEQLYNDARAKLAGREYKEAIKGFDNVERLHPYSEWAPRSQIMSAYTSYRAGKFDDALLTLDRFIKMHPGHEDAGYAYYLTALCYYEQISDVQRDQGITEQAQKALNDVVKRFPDTEYARDAKLKLDLVADHLAGKQMTIGRYYLRHNDFLAAANRFRDVIDHYQTTSHVPEALERMVEIYLNLGVKPEAVRYGAVLGNNFPSSKWYRHAYALLEKNNAKPEKEPTEGKGFFSSIF